MVNDETSAQAAVRRIQLLADRMEREMPKPGVGGFFAERLRTTLGQVDDVPNVVPLEAFVRWLISMDEPENATGRAERQRVTLTGIIQRAREALAGVGAPFVCVEVHTVPSSVSTPGWDGPHRCEGGHHPDYHWHRCGCGVKWTHLLPNVAQGDLLAEPGPAEQVWLAAEIHDAFNAAMRGAPARWDTATPWAYLPTNTRYMLLAVAVKLLQDPRINRGSER